MVRFRAHRIRHRPGRTILGQNPEPMNCLERQSGTGGLCRSSDRATGGNSEKSLANTVGEPALFSGGCYTERSPPATRRRIDSQSLGLRLRTHFGRQRSAFFRQCRVQERERVRRCDYSGPFLALFLYDL
jgi:hypothetical protein